MTDYEAFVAGKLRTHVPHGIDVDVDGTHLFPFQRDCVTWSLRRGRAALFASTGLGKSRMQLTWSKYVSEHHRTQGTNDRVIILAPLAVAAQTVREGAAIGIPVTLCREQEDVRDGINITNYDRIHKFNESHFSAVVLDESSCVKHYNSKTLQTLLARFADTPFRLCATATPSPNDYTELGTHAEFLGVCTRTEMLSEFFVHDMSETQIWRLKGHARKVFWRWVASWAALVRSPRDLCDCDCHERSHATT